MSEKLSDNWTLLLAINLGLLLAMITALKLFRVRGPELLIAAGLIAFNYWAHKSRIQRLRIPRGQYLAGLATMGASSLAIGLAASALPLWLIPMPLAIGQGLGLWMLRTGMASSARP